MEKVTSIALLSLNLFLRLFFLVRVVSNTSLEVLEVSEDDAGEYVCMVETLSQAHLVTIAGEDDTTNI
jgi:hypothetical protein